MQVVESRSLKGLYKEPSAKCLQNAENFWILQVQKALYPDWKIAQVVNALRSKDGKVRDVLLRYKISKPRNRYSGQGDVNVTRSVHSLVILLPVEEQ